MIRSIQSNVTSNRVYRQDYLFITFLTSVLVLAPTCCVAWMTLPRQQSTLHRCSRTQGKSYTIFMSSASTDSDVPPRRDVTGVTLKIALDAQGAAADLSETKSERFTSPPALDMVHRLRRDSDAVLIGKSTVEADNPSLTVRRVPLRPGQEQPVRVILDSTLSLLRNDKIGYTLFQDGHKTIVYHNVDDTTKSLEKSKYANLPEAVELVQVPFFDKTLSIETIVVDLKSRGIEHIMVEGGPRTAKLFLKAQLVDRAIMVHANKIKFPEPLLAGLGDEVLQKASLNKLGTATCGDDELVFWSKPKLSWPTTNLEDWP